MNVGPFIAFSDVAMSSFVRRYTQKGHYYFGGTCYFLIRPGNYSVNLEDGVTKYCAVQYRRTQVDGE